MLEFIDIGVDEAVAYRIGGKITEEEMTSALSILKEKIDKGEKLILYQEIVSIGGVELEAVVEKFKFLSDVGFSHFSKVAVVTDKKGLNKIVDIEDKLFKNIEIKSFSLEDKDKAIEFLKTA